MFPGRYFAHRYFPRRYFPGGVAVAASTCDWDDSDWDTSDWLTCVTELPYPSPDDGGASRPSSGRRRHHWPVRYREREQPQPLLEEPDYAEMYRELVKLRQYWEIKQRAMREDIQLLEQAVILLAVST